jgi:hypothetical protein
MHQPHYLPWLGYVDKADRADLFIFVDHVQFVRKQWHNRNYVKTQQGPTLLTVPVLQDSRAERIADKIVDERRPWRKKHRRTLEQSYGSAPFWATYGAKLAHSYDEPRERLVDVSVTSSRFVFDAFGVATPCRRSSEFGEIPGAKTEMIAALCELVGATTFVSGDQARDYLDVELLARQGVAVEWQHFAHPVYPQLHPAAGFVPRLAAIDLLLNCGPESLDILRGARGATAPHVR